MAAPPIPPPVEELGDRPFSFYPSILGVEHNEWRYVRSTWSEILVGNAKTGLELWIPRRYLGEVSAVDEPVRILGLNRELEYRGGVVRPHERRVLSMPSAAPAGPRVVETPEERAAQSKAGRRSRATAAERSIGRLVLGMLVAGILTTVAVVALFRGGASQPVASVSVSDNQYLDLVRGDDAFAVIRKLGQPEGDRWKPNSGELQYRVLDYQNRRYAIILMGTDRKTATYIGTLNQNWQVIHFVSMPNGGDTASLLRGLTKF